MAVREINGEPAYEVEALLDYRGGEDHWKNREFLVKWKDFGPEDNSWEPRLNLRCPAVLRSFLLSKGLTDDTLVKRMTANQKRAENRRRTRTDRSSVPDDLKLEPSAINGLADHLDIRLPTNGASINAQRSTSPCLTDPSSSRNDENETPSNFKMEEEEIQMNNDDEAQQAIEKIQKNRKRRSKSTADDSDIDGNLGISSENIPVNTRTVLQDVARNATDQARASSEGHAIPSTSRGHSVSSNPEARAVISSMTAPNKLIFKLSESTAKNLPYEATSTPIKQRDNLPSVDSGFNTASTSPTIESDATSNSSPKQLPPMDEHIKKNVEPAAEPPSKMRKVGGEKEGEKTDVFKSAEDMADKPGPSSVPIVATTTKLAYYSLCEVKDPAFHYKQDNGKQDYRLDSEVKKECVTAAAKKLPYSYREFKTKEGPQGLSPMESLNLAISFMKLHKNEKKEQ
ncbi:unnamed protein product [Bursaphelenchus xylophilus]|uniref:(pine wood nematode) hypothetical protein n=1 Tax=Bursaphelenchus xylophilus TaxID=6326 RepID=A0A811LCX9_BURXY|nr:unnamed protein product [Bursaphelenchus xylophilus]CAG9114030.1 unnamed protein product [Bursaphelenchus xylophilus]